MGDHGGPATAAPHHPDHRRTTRPRQRRLSFATLSPASLGSAGWGSFGVLAVVAVLGFVGFEQAPVLAEEARRSRVTIPVATYVALGLIAIVYAAAAWAMAAHAGTGHVVAAAAQQGPGLLFGLGDSVLSQTAQVLFLTSLFAAALAFHNTVWRYAFALAREGVLPGVLARTGASNIPRAASMAQSATGLAAITGFALAGANPMATLFFWLGTTGGFGVLLLLALTSVAVIVFFDRDPRGESTWVRLTAPFLAALALTTIIVLAVLHYATLLGVPPGSAAAWALPAAYAVVAGTGVVWGLVLKARRPQVHAAIGLGAHAASSPTPAQGEAR
jgi:amino acid transporter